MASPSSVDTIYSFSDSVSDVVTLDMSDDCSKPAPDEEVFAFRTPTPVFEKEGSLNSSMITIIVSLQGMLAVHCFTDILFYR